MRWVGMPIRLGLAIVFGVTIGVICLVAPKKFEPGQEDWQEIKKFVLEGV